MNNDNWFVMLDPYTVGRRGPIAVLQVIARIPPDNDVSVPRLIAAAPDLLEALQEIAGQSTPNRWGYDAGIVALNDEWRAKAREAIRKATQP